MDLEWLRHYCLKFPHVHEQVQWENALVFKVGGKMFLVMRLEPAPVACSFKCTPEMFSELVERPGVIPAPYLARASWVALQDSDAIPTAELKQLVQQSYELVREKLPKKTKLELDVSTSRAKAPR
ncbi:MAG: MmcQ/YjbR family DNA-binding protein [Bryobacteraceae bacterium]